MVKLNESLKELLDVRETIVATSDDMQRGLFQGAILGTTGAYCYGFLGASLGFTSGLLFNLYNSPSNRSWDKFVKKRAHNATPQKRKTPFVWQSAATIAGLTLTGLLLGKKSVASFFDFSSIQDLQEAIVMKQNGLDHTFIDNYLAQSIKETAGIAWKLSWLGYMANEANKTFSNGFLTYVSKDVKKVASTLKISFQSKEARIKAYGALANENNPVGLYYLYKTFLEQGKTNEALAAILNYYFKNDQIPESPYGSHTRKKKLIELELKQKPAVDSFTVSLLLPVDKSLIDYYADLAVQEAKENKDAATLSLLALYQSHKNQESAKATWKAVASIASNSKSLAEKVLGEGNSGGASRLLFEGSEDDPLRWSIVKTSGEKSLLVGKYNLGNAIHLGNKKRLLKTPQMFSLEETGNEHHLFRQQLWGVPLDEFSRSTNLEHLDLLYYDILKGIWQLQNAYDAQDVVEIPETNWEEKFLAKENNFYNKKQIEQSLEWLLENNPSCPVYPIKEFPIVDPYVRNIGVHEQKDGSLLLPYWDVEPKTRAPRIYDYATLLLTAKPSLLQETFSKTRRQALHMYELHDSFSSETTNRAYAGAVVLRTLGLLKAWSNEQKQSGLVSSRPQLLSSALRELSYLKQQGDNNLANFAESNTVLLERLHPQLGKLQERFSR